MLRSVFAEWLWSFTLNYAYDESGFHTFSVYIKHHCSFNDLISNVKVRHVLLNMSICTKYCTSMSKIRGLITTFK